MELTIIPIKSFVHNFSPPILNHGDNTNNCRKSGVQDSCYPSLIPWNDYPLASATINAGTNERNQESMAFQIVELPLALTKPTKVPVPRFGSLNPQPRPPIIPASINHQIDLPTKYSVICVEDGFSSAGPKLGTCSWYRTASQKTLSRFDH